MVPTVDDHRTESGLPSNSRAGLVEICDLQTKPRRSKSVTRSRPIIQAPANPPVCLVCHSDDGDSFFDVHCQGCRNVLQASSTSIGQMFAILRQWIPRTQHGLELIIAKMLDIGAHVDDRDGLTDMTMLHYACKAGTRGIGDVNLSCRVVDMLLSNHADPYLRCRWTNMAGIHYATYFDVAPVVAILLAATKAVDVDSPCSEFDHGSPLHIAARNLAVESARVLLLNEADPFSRDFNGKTPLEWLPAQENFEPDSEAGRHVVSLRTLLSEARQSGFGILNWYEPPRGEDAIAVIEGLHAIGLAIGDKVVVGGIKTGTLRYCGKTAFASGLWAGIQLNEAVGKNNGSVAGVRYFKCPSDYGIFAPLSKISRPGILHTAQSRGSIGSVSGGITRNISAVKINVDHVTAKINTGLRGRKMAASSSDESGSGVLVGDRVLVAGRRRGIVRYYGETQFGPGSWFGIELDKPGGKNDGSVNGVRYFECTENYGVFAPSKRVQKYVDAPGSDVESTSSLNLSTSASVGDVYQITTPISGESCLINHLSQQTLQGGSSSSPRRTTLRSRMVLGSHSLTSALSSSHLSNTPLRLTVGMNVLCAGEIGTVRYIGAVDFAEGLWIGVELKSAKGKHDGTVQGRRYFVCRAGHGLIVRPGKLTVHGINGVRLVNEH